MNRKRPSLFTPLALATLVVAPSARASAGSFELVLRGGYVVRAGGASEVAALVAVSMPMDRAARPRLAEGPSTPRTPRPPPLVVSAALARAAILAAFRAAGRPRALERYDSLAARARAAAALPELRLRAARATDESLRFAPTSADPSRYSQAGGVSLALEAQATWRLDRAVFADEEIQVEHLRRLRARQDARLVDDVLRALFAWQRALAGAADPSATPEERELAALRAVEAEVRLDVLTGGWFSPRARALGKNALPRTRVSE